MISRDDFIVENSIHVLCELLTTNVGKHMNRDDLVQESIHLTELLADGLNLKQHLKINY